MSPLKLTEGKSDPNSCWDTLRVESIKKTRDSTEIPSPRDCTWSANVCVWFEGRRGGGIHLWGCHCEVYHVYLASFPGLLHLQFLIACSMHKRREKARRISSRNLQHNCQMSSCLLSIAKWYTRPILHSALATKMGQAPAGSYPERINHIPAIRHDSKRLLSDKRENTYIHIAVTQSSRGVKRWHYLELHRLYHSHSNL